MNAGTILKAANRMDVTNEPAELIVRKRSASNANCEKQF